MQKTITATQIKLAESKFNAGKSLSIEISVNMLQGIGFKCLHTRFTGYVDTKPAGQRYVTSRKEKTFYKVVVLTKNHDIVDTFDSSMTVHTAYSLTSFVITELNKFYKSL